MAQRAGLLAQVALLYPSPTAQLAGAAPPLGGRPADKPLAGRVGDAAEWDAAPRVDAGSGAFGRAGSAQGLWRAHGERIASRREHSYEHAHLAGGAGGGDVLLPSLRGGAAHNVGAGVHGAAQWPASAHGLGLGGGQHLPTARGQVPLGARAAALALPQHSPAAAPGGAAFPRGRKPRGPLSPEESARPALALSAPRALAAGSHGTGRSTLAGMEGPRRRPAAQTARSTMLGDTGGGGGG
jgi:hypothetical protein